MLNLMQWIANKKKPYLNYDWSLFLDRTIGSEMNVSNAKNRAYERMFRKVFLRGPKTTEDDILLTFLIIFLI